VEVWERKERIGEGGGEGEEWGCRGGRGNGENGVAGLGKARVGGEGKM